MANSWNDIIRSQEYLNASQEERDAVHLDYFNKVIAPQAKANGDDVNAVFHDYMANTSPTPYYDHSTKDNMSQGEYFSNQWQQIEDLAGGAVALANKWSGNEYSQSDIDEAHRALDSNEGQTMRTGAAVLSSIVAPELIPEIGLGEGITWLSNGSKLAEIGLKNAASSSAYQMVDNGSINPTQLAIDTGIGYGLEGGLAAFNHARLNPNVEGLANVVSPVYKDTINSEIRSADIERAEDSVHAAYQIKTLASILEEAKKLNPNATAGDALRAWARAAPEMHDTPYLLMQQVHGAPSRIRAVEHQTPLQQVIEILTGREVAPSVDIGEMALMVDGMSPEQMMGIREGASKLANRQLREAQKALGKYNGRFKDIADTQRLIEENTTNPLLKSFSSDILSYGNDVLDELKVGKATRFASLVAGKAENLSLANKTLRNMQFNKIAETFGKNTKQDLSSTLSDKIKSANKAHEEYRAFRSQNNLSDIAQAEVLRARAAAESYGVENLEDLSSQIANVRAGKQVKTDLFNNAMYNSQLRKFVALEDDADINTAQALRDKSRQTKLMSGTATARTPWSSAMQQATVGYLIADELSDQVLGGLGNAIGAVAGVAGTGYATKRVIDGAINNALAEASRLMNESNGFKDAVDDAMSQWSKEYETEKGHAPSETEYFEAADYFVKEMLKARVREKAIGLGSVATRAAVATNLGNSLFTR